MDTNITAKLLLDIFGGHDYHAKLVENMSGAHYFPVEEPLGIEKVREHLDGVETLGAYHLIPDTNTVRWLGWDVDSNDLDQAKQLALKILKYLTNIPHAVEFSGRKGYHILIFLEEEITAKDAQKVVEEIRKKEDLNATGETHVECYPKQARLSKDKPKGNLLKLPLGVHYKSKNRSRFIDVNNGWEGGPDLNPYEILKYRASVEDVMGLINQSPDPFNSIVELIAPYWTEGSRHDLALYLSGFLATDGWSLDNAKKLMKAICDKTNDAEIFNRDQTVSTTFKRFHENKTVRGRQGLAEYLPVPVMQRLSEFSSFMKSPNSLLQVDEIRYSKGRTKLEAARMAAHYIWQVFNDSGSLLFQTNDSRAFWYDDETHETYQEGTEWWTAILNGKFGLNPVESFSRMVMQEIRLRILRDSPTIPIQKRSYWDADTKNLFVNLGGPEVYIVKSENNIEKAYNGQCGHFFATDVMHDYTVPDFSADPKDSWDHLINDLSFVKSADAPATPAEQQELLKAWILSFFFKEIMPTRPILSLIGAPGSGKTTAIRRIVRILENPHADVLGIPTDKQDALRSSIERHSLLVIDNLEKSGAWWMVDILNKLATGHHIEIRQLYKTNAIHLIIPKCYVALTAVNIPFSDETLFTRLLVLEMQKLDNPIPEHSMQKTITKNLPAIWADLLRKLSIIVGEIAQEKLVKAPTKSRLVDFTVFCERIKECSIINGQILSRGLLSMTDSQMKQLQESSQAVNLLREWISLRPQEANEWMTFAQLFNTLVAMAGARRVQFNWKTAQALFRHFSTISEILQREYQAEFKGMTNGSDPATTYENVRVKFNTTFL